MITGDPDFVHVPATTLEGLGDDRLRCGCGAEGTAAQIVEHALHFMPRCAWFLLCDELAVTTRSHPILGDVPICGRCDDKIAALMN